MCEAFQVEELALMIRATRGRSRRPNHMRSLLDALQTPAPVNLRRVPRGFHSVAKQASSKTPFFHGPARFWSDFWKFLEVKMEVKRDSGEVFF